MIGWLFTPSFDPAGILAVKAAIDADKEVWMTTWVNENYDSGKLEDTVGGLEDRTIFILDDENPVRIISNRREDGWHTGDPQPITFTKHDDEQRGPIIVINTRSEAPSGKVYRGVIRIHLTNKSWRSQKAQFFIKDDSDWYRGPAEKLN